MVTVQLLTNTSYRALDSIRSRFLPYCFKPLYAYVSNKWPIKGDHRCVYRFEIALPTFFLNCRILIAPHLSLSLSLCRSLFHSHTHSRACACASYTTMQPAVYPCVRCHLSAVLRPDCHLHHHGQRSVRSDVCSVNGQRRNGAHLRDHAGRLRLPRFH